VSAPRQPLRPIDRDECLRLLAADEVGRIAVVHGGTPAIFPVNYLLDGDEIVFRTGPGTKLEANGRGQACFEIDAVDRETRSGWSVTATGRLEEVTQYDRAWRHVQALPVEPWAEGDRSHWLRLVPSTITGRRIPPSR
jgi:nitroimidazol reductase NimA-like FMN-containing flavoprotein (pyridoxamine 5'-phosphate oxidase superfamily)